MGGPVEHWGPEVPHKGEKGSKITKKCPKRPNTYPRYTNKNEKKIIFCCSHSAPKAPGAWRGGEACLLNMDLDVSSLGFDKISGHKMVGCSKTDGGICGNKDQQWKEGIG